MGKTEIAAEFAHRHAQDYDIIWWIRSEDEDRVQDAFVKLGRRLDLPHADDYPPDKFVPTVIDALHHGPFERWLLIFDSATEPAVVKRYLPRAGGTAM